MTATPELHSRAQALALDQADPLRGLRQQFSLPEGVVYLDGNSLGALPRSAAASVAQVVQQQWGQGLIRSWNDAGWMAAPQQVGDRIARLVGAAPGELLVADSTSVNLYKALAAAIDLAQRADPGRRVILTEAENFPTDRYIADSLAAQHGLRIEAVAADDLVARLRPGGGPGVALLMLTQVNYRSGRLLDMAALNVQAHAAGALTVWDLAHSAGALPVQLNGPDGAPDDPGAADFAVGCGYKYLNGGPGAPAFVWMHRRHSATARQPLTGWLGHAAPFRFEPGYQPAPGIGRFVCGTPAVIGLAALACGVDTLLAAEDQGLGGMAALRAKSLALTEAFIALADRRLARHGLQVASPRDGAQRGSQVSLAGSPGGQAPTLAMMQALIAHGVIGDYRAGDAASGLPDLLRFGFAPLYNGFTDVWDAVEALDAVLASGQWREPRFQPDQGRAGVVT